jgi:hypothetical protein
MSLYVTYKYIFILLYKYIIILLILLYHYVTILVYYDIMLLGPHGTDRAKLAVHVDSRGAYLTFRSYNKFNILLSYDSHKHMPTLYQNYSREL